MYRRPPLFRPGKHKNFEMLLLQESLLFEDRFLFFFFATNTHEKHYLSLQLVSLQSNKGHGLIGEPLEIFKEINVNGETNYLSIK